MPRFCYSIRFWQLLNRRHSADGHVSPNCRARNSSWLVASFFCFFFLHTTSQGIFSNSTKDAASTVNQYRRCQQEIRSRFCGTCFWRELEWHAELDFESNLASRARPFHSVNSKSLYWGRLSDWLIWLCWQDFRFWLQVEDRRRGKKNVLRKKERECTKKERERERERGQAIGWQLKKGRWILISVSIGFFWWLWVIHNERNNQARCDVWFETTSRGV